MRDLCVAWQAGGTAAALERAQTQVSRAPCGVIWHAELVLRASANRAAAPICWLGASGGEAPRRRSEGEGTFALELMAQFFLSAFSLKPSD